jgi:hypothetical protein
MSSRERDPRYSRDESRDRSKERSKKSRKSKFDLSSPDQQEKPRPKSSLFTDQPPEGFVPNAQSRF